MTLCRSCGQHIPDNSPLTAIEVAHATSLVRNFYSGLNGSGLHTLILRDADWVVTLIDKDECGYDNEGPAHCVFQIDGPGGEQYFKVTGHYSSYDGYEWDAPLKEVRPAQKTVIVYE